MRLLDEAQPITLDPGERDQVDIAFSPRAMGELLRNCLGDLRLRQSDRRTPCNILDAKYEPGKGCTILYQLGENLVTGHWAWPPLTHNDRRSRAIESLGMDVYVFPDDPFLPGLVSALNGHLMKEILGKVLPACSGGEARVLRCKPSLLRYRPARRCTVRLEVTLQTKSTGAIKRLLLFAKLYHDSAKATALFVDDVDLSKAASLPEAGVIVAMPSGFVPHLAMVLHESVSGIPLSGLVPDPRTGRCDGSDGLAAVKRAAAAVASIHGVALQSKRTRPEPGEAVTRMAMRSTQVSLVDALLGERMKALATELLGSLDRLNDWGSERTFVHGDCKPSQFLIDGSNVAVLDFDHGGMADPASDVGTFTASIRQLELRQRVAGAKPLPSQDPYWLEVERVFLSEYRARREPDGAFFQRTRWYQGAALLRKALRAFQRSPRSPLPGVLTEEGFRTLGSLAPGSRSLVDASPVGAAS